MKVKRKGKVYPASSSPSVSPSPPPSSSSSLTTLFTSSYNDPDSVLKILPVTILALALSLPIQDREVLAYLVARSIITTTNTNTKNPFFFNKQQPKTKSRANKNSKTVVAQNIHVFECGCFDCYTSFWYRWDSSPNRELIHHVIEAFEEHLVQNECAKKHIKGKRNGKTIMGRLQPVDNEPEMSVPETGSEEPSLPAKDNEVVDVEDDGVICLENEDQPDVGEVVTADAEMEAVAVQGGGSNHKGLARKVLPDVVGLLNSRLWSLWSPGI